MERKIITMLFCFGAIFAAYGCYVRAYAVVPGPVVVSVPPPETVIVVEHDSCPADHVWVNDYYHWNGHSWTVVKGECAYRSGYIWVAPTYITIKGGVNYTQGYWKPVSGTHHVKGTPPAKGGKPKPPPSKHKKHPPVKAIPK